MMNLEEKIEGASKVSQNRLSIHFISPPNAKNLFPRGVLCPKPSPSTLQASGASLFVFLRETIVARTKLTELRTYPQSSFHAYISGGAEILTEEDFFELTANNDSIDVEFLPANASPVSSSASTPSVGQRRKFDQVESSETGGEDDGKFDLLLQNLPKPAVPASVFESEPAPPSPPRKRQRGRKSAAAAAASFPPPTAAHTIPLPVSSPASPEASSTMEIDSSAAAASPAASPSASSPSTELASPPDVSPSADAKDKKEKKTKVRPSHDYVYIYATPPSLVTSSSSASNLAAVSSGSSSPAAPAAAAASSGGGACPIPFPVVVLSQSPYVAFDRSISKFAELNDAHYGDEPDLSVPRRLPAPVVSPAAALQAIVANVEPTTGEEDLNIPAPLASVSSPTSIQKPGPHLFFFTSKGVLIDPSRTPQSYKLDPSLHNCVPVFVQGEETLIRIGFPLERRRHLISPPASYGSTKKSHSSRASKASSAIASPLSPSAVADSSSSAVAPTLAIAVSSPASSDSSPAVSTVISASSLFPLTPTLSPSAAAVVVAAAAAAAAAASSSATTDTAAATSTSPADPALNSTLNILRRDRPVLSLSASSLNVYRAQTAPSSTDTSIPAPISVPLSHPGAVPLLSFLAALQSLPRQNLFASSSTSTFDSFPSSTSGFSSSSSS